MLPRLLPNSGGKTPRAAEKDLRGKKSWNKSKQKNKTIGMKKSILIAMTAGLAYAFPANAQKQVAKTFTMPVQAHVDVGFSDCSNSPGPQITLDGSITFGGLNVELIFRNSVKGIHTYVAESTSEVVAVPA